MYTIYFNGDLIYDPRKESTKFYLLNPKYSAEMGKVDSLSFSILPSHPYYDVFTRLQPGVVAYRDGVEIFRGRILTTSVDTYGEKQVECEGDLAYLLDTLQPKIKEDEITCEALFRRVIANHNLLVDEDKQFTVGEITATKKNDEIKINQTSFSTTRSTLDSYILKPKGGYLKTRYEEGVTYIDWIQDYNRYPDQVIELGVNMVSYQEEIASDDFYTMFMPVGTRPAGDDETPDDSSSDTSSEDRTMTIEEVNDGSPYIELTELVEQYGKIYHTESYSEAESPAELLQNGMDDVTEYRKKLKRTVEVGALDLHYINPNIDMLMVGDRVRIVSGPHLKDEVLVVTQVDWDFVSPESDKYSFGDGIQTLTKKTEKDSAVAKKNAVDAKTAAKSNSANLKLNKNKIDIVANNMSLEVKEQLKLNLDTVSVMFRMMELNGKEYTFKTDEEKAQMQLLKDELEREFGSVTNRINATIDAETGRAWSEAVSIAVTNWGRAENNIGMALDSQAGTFSWSAMRQEFEDLKDDTYDAIERTKKAGISFNGPASEVKLFATDDSVKELDDHLDEATRRVGNVEVILNGTSGNPGLVATVSGKVGADEIISAINMSPEEIQISSDRIHLDGQTIANLIASVAITSPYITATQELTCTGTFNCNLEANLTGGINLGDSYITGLDALADIRLQSNANGTYSLYKTPYLGEETLVGTFSRAATSLTGSWSSGTFTATTGSGGLSKTTSLYQVAPSDITWSGLNGSFPVYADLDNDDTVKINTGRVMNFTCPTPTVEITIGDFSGEELGYPISSTAYINGVEVASDTAFLEALPPEADDNMLYIDTENHCISMRPDTGIYQVDITASMDSYSINPDTGLGTVLVRTRANNTVIRTNYFNFSVDKYTSVTNARGNLTWQGYRTLYEYDSVDNRYISAGTGYWYSSTTKQSLGTLYRRTQASSGND